MPKNSASSKVIRAFKNPTVRVLILIVILFAATYGGVEVMRLALHSESPLMVVSSGSMVPVLNVGDIIIVRGVDPQTVTVGTIIIFHSPYEYDMPIVHRVVAVLNEGGSLFFQTKGDHNGIQDGWKVPAANLMGVYVMKIPYVGLISLELRGPLGVTLIILLVALIILVEYSESKSPKKKT
ncbi:MAG: signal peptidase I [Candidatus Bathyarchaeia archaeon]